MPKYPPFLDDCPQIDFDIVQNSPDSISSPIRHPQWGLLARRVMSPFKEFIKYAKRHNNIPDIDPNFQQSEEIAKDSSIRIKNTSKLYKQSKKIKDFNSKNKQNKAAQNQQQSKPNGASVSFQIDEKINKSGSRVSSMYHSKNESQIRDQIQNARKFNEKQMINLNPLKSSSQNGDSRSSQNVLPVVDEVENDFQNQRINIHEDSVKASHHLNQNSQSLMKRVEQAVRNRVLASIEKFKQMQSPKRDIENINQDLNFENQLQKQFNLKSFINNFESMRSENLNLKPNQFNKTTSNFSINRGRLNQLKAHHYSTSPIPKTNLKRKKKQKNQSKTIYQTFSNVEISKENNGIDIDVFRDYAQQTLNSNLKINKSFDNTQKNKKSKFYLNNNPLNNTQNSFYGFNSNTSISKLKSLYNLKNDKLLSHLKQTSKAEKLQIYNNFTNSQLNTLLMQKRNNLQLQDKISKQNIPGRGGASMTLINDSKEQATLLIACGASRDQQFSDFWTVTIDKETLQPTSAQQLKVIERDGFTGRNSMTSVYHPEKNRVVYFGGQDSEAGVLYNDLFTLDLNNLTLTHHDYLDGQVTPAPRNSHTMTLSSDGKSVFVFGGANQDGPLRDLYKLDLETLVFKQIKLNDQDQPLPFIEMHTAELYNKDFLLILGGRGIFSGQSLDQAAFQNTMYLINVSDDVNEQGIVSKLGDLPSDLSCHVSSLINDEHIVTYGGTNGLRFFDSVTRYSISQKKWTLMTGIPENCKKSRFFQDGRISPSQVAVKDEFLVIFGGSSIEKECNDFLIVPFAHISKDENFNEINEIM
eukprot:403370917